MVTDIGAAVLQRFAYDAYGNMLAGTNLTSVAAALTTLLYSGEQTDPTGLQYLRARFYNPANGRFNRLDTFAGSATDPLTLHKYLYAQGNSINGIDPSGREFSIAGIGVASSINAGLNALTVINYARFAYDFAKNGSEALTFWNIVSLIPFGYDFKLIGKGLGKGITAVRQVAAESPVIGQLLLKYGDDIARVVAKYRGVVSGNLGTQVHEAFKSSRIGKAVLWLEKVLQNNDYVRVTLDKSILTGGGIGSRPDITFQFPKFKFAVALDIKPVPQSVFDQGWLACMDYLYDSKSNNITGRREGTRTIFEREYGYQTLYLYIPYPSFYQ